MPGVTISLVIEKAGYWTIGAAGAVGALAALKVSGLRITSYGVYGPGARIAMGNSFLTVVSAEIVSADNGLGALIWTARNFARTEWVFVGILALGLLGYLFDRLLRLAVAVLLRRYRLTT